MTFRLAYACSGMTPGMTPDRLEIEADDAYFDLVA